MKRFLISILISSVTLNPIFSYGGEFKNDDYILILVTGDCNRSTEWGGGGKASMYRYSQNFTPVNENVQFIFSPVVEFVDVERRSAKSTTPIDDNVNNEIRYDYSNKANIPPGVYSLHHHRFDYNSYPELNNSVRHRLGLSDKPCSLTPNQIFELNSCCSNMANPISCCGSNNCYSSNCDEVIKYKENGNEFSRCFLQFHVAFNNLNEYSYGTNEGCIVLNENNFSKLFPSSFLDLPTSPLIRHDIPIQIQNQKGRVLVFITDLTFNKKTYKCENQDNQIAYFNSILSGGLNDNHFNDTSQRQQLKENWALHKAITPEIKGVIIK